MKTLSLVLSLLMAGAVACGGDDHEHEDFETYLECYEHGVEEGLSDVGATSECDAHFEVTHTDAATCVTDHQADVTDGVPQAAIEAHCAAQ